MRKLISKLHEKPEEHRRAIALGVSAFITLMILGVWLSTSPFSFNGGAVAEDVQKNLQDNITPLATVKASFDQAMDSFEAIKNWGN